MKDIKYEEIQYLRGTPFFRKIFVAATLITAIMIYNYNQYIVNGVDIGMSKNEFYIVGTIVMLLVFAILYLVFKSVMHTKINKDGIFVKFMPFHKRPRYIGWEEIRKVEIRTYKAFKEYGGRGIRTSRKGLGKSFTIAGKYGLQIYLKNKQRVLIGTQNIKDLSKVLNDINR